MKINWAKKLTSRKFWMALVGFIVPMLIAFGVSEEVAAQVSGIIMSGASVVAYIIAEGLVDANSTTWNDNGGDDSNV